MNNSQGKESQTNAEQLHNARRYAMPGGKQFVDLCRTDLLTADEFRGAMKYNILKYTLRYQRKGGLTDLRKAQQYTKYLEDFEAELEAEKAEMQAYTQQ